MQKALILTAVLVAGCATVQVGNQSREVNILPSWAASVQLNNECTPNAKLYQAGKGVVLESVPMGHITNKTVYPLALSSDRYVTLTFQVFASDGRTLLGSVDQTIYEGSGVLTAASWKIGGSSWSGGMYTSEIHDSQGRNVCRMNHVG